MMKKIILLLSIVINILTFAQFSHRFQNPKSPEVYQMEKYGKQDINLYTGKPSIKIPLFDIQYGQIKIPLALSYSSNGIRGDEEASRVGLGWYFDQPMITQTINGYDDLEMRLIQLEYYNYYKPYFIVEPQPGYLNSRMTYNSIEQNFLGAKPDRLTYSNSFKANASQHLNDFFLAKVRSENNGFWGTNNTWFSSNNNMSFLSDPNFSGFANLQLDNPIIGPYGKDYDIEKDLFSINLFGENILFYRKTSQLFGGSYGTSYSDSQFYILNKRGYKIDYNKASGFTIIDRQGIKYVFSSKLISARSTQYGSVSFTGQIANYFDAVNRPANYISNDAALGTPSYAVSGTTDSNFALGTTNFSRISNQWKLTYIEDNNGNKVYFDYDRLPDVSRQNKSISGKCDFIQVAGTTYNTYDKVHGVPEVEYSPIVIGLNQLDFTPGYKVKCMKNEIPSQIIQSNFLNSITYGDTKISFSGSNRNDIIGDMKIDSIAIKYNGKPVKNVSFDYEYYPENHALSKRLKLTSLKINNLKYTFRYNESNVQKFFDYWGYFNGIPSQTPFVNPFRLYKNESDIPSLLLPLKDQVKDTENKSAHPENIKVGLLEKIIYPTGGYTKFKYELNTFDNYFFPNYDNKITVENSGSPVFKDYNQNTSNGFGVRVKETQDYDFNNDLLSTTKYTYVGGKHIPPFKLSDPNIVNDQLYHHMDETIYDAVCQCQKYYRDAMYNTSGYKITSANSNIYQTNQLGNGDFVGYDKVIVEELKLNNQSKGKSIFYYANTPDESPSFGITDGTPKTEFDKFGFSVRKTNVLENGSLLKKEIYDSNNNLLKKDSLTYSNVVFNDGDNSFNVKVIPTETTGYMHIHPGFLTPNDQIMWYTFANYNFYYYPLRGIETILSNKVAIDYFGNEKVVTKENYQYHPDLLIPTIETVITPSNDQIQENTTYSYIVDRLRNKNILTNIINQARYKNNKQLPWTSVKYDDLLHYNPTSETTYELNSPNNNPTADVTYDKYDNKGNLLQYTSKAGIPTSIIWGYSQTQPIAKIEGAHYANVQNLATDIINASNTDNIAAPGNDETLFLEKLDIFRKKSELINYQITTYTYDPLIGIRSITSPTGLRNVYIYDNENRLKEVRENDINGKIVKEYQYNFAPIRYYNTTKSQSFFKANCSGIPSSYLYTVPSDTYYSNISQADADQQAQNDINANGQNAANNNGTCTPMSCNLSFNSAIGINGGGGIGIINNSTPHFKLTFGMSTGSNSINLPWNTGVKIGTINGNCRPANDYSSYNGSIYYTVKTNGDVILKTLGSPFPNNSSYNYEFTYPIN